MKHLIETLKKDSTATNKEHKEPIIPYFLKDGTPVGNEKEPEPQLSKDNCVRYIELCNETWLEDKEIDEIWNHQIKRTKDKDNKILETVSRKELKHYVLERTFEKGWIKISRFENALEKAPWKKKLEIYEQKLIDFI